MAQYRTASSPVPNRAQAAYASQIAFWFHIFIFLWTKEFICAVSSMCIAGAVCKWYWTQPAKSADKELGWPVATSVWRTYRYHLGSLAMGSVLVALVSTVRKWLMYVELQTSTFPDNPVVKVVVRVIACFLYCLEKCIKFVTSSAYVIIALKGTGFWTSTADGTAPHAPHADARTHTRTHAHAAPTPCVPLPGAHPPPSLPPSPPPCHA